MVHLEHPIDSGIRGVGPTQLVPIHDLTAEHLEALRDADAGTDEILAAVTGLSPGQVARLTDNDRSNIIQARRTASA
jgi:hypothetical protein